MKPKQYETIRQVQLDWPTMQEHFRQKYSKFVNTTEQYFHVWRSFQFDEATDTIDRYIHKVKQVAALLDYGEPQILELFKKHITQRIILLAVPYRQSRCHDRDSQKNIDKRKDR